MKLTGEERASVAVFAGLDVSTVYRWQAGKKIRIDSEKRIAHALVALGIVDRDSRAAEKP